MSYITTNPLKNSTIMFLYSEKDEIATDPPYQRMGDVWTKEKKRLLIDSILNDYDIPKIYFHELSSEDYTKTGKKYSVIDGRQRLETIWGFIENEFTLSDKFEYQRDSDIDLSNLSYSDIAKLYPKIRVKFDSFVLPVVAVSTEDGDLDLIEDMFSRLNEAVPLNAAEKRNAFGGAAVKAINELSATYFFTENVRFPNRRYQHKEVSSRILLLEINLIQSDKIIDTKKVYLDDMVRKHHSGSDRALNVAKEAGQEVLNIMSKIFTKKDELLSSQGSIVVYYLIFRYAHQNGEVEKLDRRKFIDFRDKIALNRQTASEDYANSSFDLLEYDRLNQQGTNDAYNIKERYRILATELQLSRLEL